MRNKLALLFIPALTVAAHAAQSAAATPVVDFPQNGFSIAAYEAAPSATATTAALTMRLPSDNGFASNVNVVVQPYPKPMSDFVALSKSQFAQFGAVIVAEKSPNANDWICEYQATVNGKKLHFYARAISAGDHVYLATGSALEEQWSTLAAKIKACVDTLQAKGKAASPTPAK